MRTSIQVLLGIAVCAALVVIGVMLWVDRMTPVNITISTLDAQSMHVSVDGAVATPGVVEVPIGARLQDVVNASGGFRGDADLSVLNLAGRVGDGERIEIPSTTDSPQSTVAGPGDSGLVNLNTATVTELDALPGIGEVLAGRIVEYRETNGPFESVDQLIHIDGISTNLVETLTPLVTVDPGD